MDNQLTESLRVYRIATDIAPNLETSWIEFIVFLLEVNQLRTAEHVIQEAFLNIITPRLEILNVGIHYTLNRKKTALKLFKKFTEQTKDIMPSLLFEYFPALANEEDILDLIRK